MQQTAREIPYVQRIIPNLLDDVRRARNNGSPDEYSRAVDTLEMFLPIEKPKNIKHTLQQFKEGMVPPEYDGNGFFSQSYDDKKREIREQFENSEIREGERRTMVTDYRFQYVMYLLENAGLLVHEHGGAFDIDNI